MVISKKGTICFSQGGKNVCYYYPVFGPPVQEHPALETEGEHYTSLYLDTALVQSIHQATSQISDSGTRAAMKSGIAAAVAAMEKRGAAEKVKITLGD
jgi:hypothetical protein